MSEYERTAIIRRLIAQYVQSPSLKHLRDPNSLHQIASSIAKELEPREPLWTKWDANRVMVIERAVGCWVPANELRDFLNTLPGARLTLGDVEQRLRDEEEKQRVWPNEEYKDECLAIYAREKSEGTEPFAIIGLIRTFIETSEDRARADRAMAYQKSQEDAYQASVNRLMSGADSKWVQIRGSTHWYCRLNGRSYRLSPCQNGKWQLYRVDRIVDDEKGVVIGRYAGRRAASVAIEELAFNADVR